MREYVCLKFSFEKPEPWSDVFANELMESGCMGCEQENNRLIAYVESGDFDPQIIKWLEANFPEAKHQLEKTIIPEKNWNHFWESNYDPVEIGSEIYIYAPFHQAKSGFRYTVEIMPRMSFGTGHHATTRLMMEAMLNENLKDKSVLDVGCGSGILSILAEKMGASSALAFDIDDWCVENTSDNIEKNRCTKIEIRKGTIRDMVTKSYNIILANINRNTIVEELNTYFKFLKNSGLILISGFQKEDVNVLEKKAEQLGLEVFEKRELNNWCMMKLGNPHE